MVLADVVVQGPAGVLSEFLFSNGHLCCSCKTLSHSSRLCWVCTIARSILESHFCLNAVLFPVFVSASHPITPVSFSASCEG